MGRIGVKIGMTIPNDVWIQASLEMFLAAQKEYVGCLSKMSVTLKVASCQSEYNSNQQSAGMFPTKEEQCKWADIPVNFTEKGLLIQHQNCSRPKREFQFHEWPFYKSDFASGYTFAHEDKLKSQSLRNCFYLKTKTPVGVFVWLLSGCFFSCSQIYLGFFWCLRFRNFDTFLSCTKEAVSDECSAAAAEHQNTVYMKLFKPLLDASECSFGMHSFPALVVLCIFGVCGDPLKMADTGYGFRPKLNLKENFPSPLTEIFFLFWHESGAETPVYGPFARSGAPLHFLGHACTF